MSVLSGQNEDGSASPPPGELVEQLRRGVAERVQDVGTLNTAELSDVVNEEIAAWVRERAASGTPPPSSAQEQHLADHVLSALHGLGGLAPLIGRDDVENIHVHGCDEVWVEYASGRLHRWPTPVAASDEELLTLISSLFARRGRTSREWTPAHPLGTLRLPDGGPLGCRIAAMRSVVDRPRIAIRRHRTVQADLPELERLGTVTDPVRRFLTSAVQAGLNILVTGAPSAGKTALLRALAHEVPPHEHLAVVEDDAELGLHLCPHLHPLVTAAETRSGNAEGEGEVGLDALLQQVLRHSPSRVLVGEVRGGEITSLLRALGNGAAGGMSTLHARSPRAVPDRIAALAQLASPPLPVAAAYRWMSASLNLIVHITRYDGPDGRQRRVSEITEVGQVGDADIPDLTTLVRSDPDGQTGALAPPSPALHSRLSAVAGYDRSMFSGPMFEGELP